MYIVAQCGENESDGYRLLKIELANDLIYEGSLADILFHDDRVYSKRDIQVLLSTVHNGNKAYYRCYFMRNRTGGLIRVCSAKAILGFVRFTRYYYIVVANEIKPEGVIMGHIVYSITVSLPYSSSRLEL